MSQVREREISFEVDGDWSMPDLSCLVPERGRAESDSARLHATYFDTSDDVLRRLGVTLRRRTGGDDAGWHLKLPAGSARLELRSGSRSQTLPSALAEPLQGVTGSEALREVATITTARQVQRLLDQGGELVLEVADDRVGAAVTGETAARAWREVEAELGPSGDEDVLARVRSLLTGAGARVGDTRVKLDRALGALPVFTPKPALAGLIAEYVTAQVAQILRGDIALRMGTDIDPVHDTRVAIRRLRSVLKIYRRAFDDTAHALSDELRWLGGVLGDVRDCDVLAENLAAEVDALPVELVLGPVNRELTETLALERKAAVARWHRARSEERYQALLATLVSWLRRPPVRVEQTLKARKVLAKAEKKVARRLSRAGDDPARLHAVRKAAKRLRYAAELAAPRMREATKTAKGAKKLQRLLGDHQDQVVAHDFLRAEGARRGSTDGHNGFTYGLLMARADEKARRLRAKLRAL